MAPGSPRPRESPRDMDKIRRERAKSKTSSSQQTGKPVSRQELDAAEKRMEGEFQRQMQTHHASGSSAEPARPEAGESGAGAGVAAAAAPATATGGFHGAP